MLRRLKEPRGGRRDIKLKNRIWRVVAVEGREVGENGRMNYGKAMDSLIFCGI